MKKSFLHIKQNYQNKIATNHHRITVMKKCFVFWCMNLKELFYEKENEQITEFAVEEYIDRKNKIKVMYLFQKWKNLMEENQ